MDDNFTDCTVQTCLKKKKKEKCGTTTIPAEKRLLLGC